MTNEHRQANDPEPTVPAEAILAAVPTPIVVLDEQGTILDANPAIQQWGIPRADILGRAWSELNVPAADEADAEGPHPGQASQDTEADHAPVCEQNIVDHRGDVHRVRWTDREGPRGDMLRVGVAIPKANRIEPIGQASQGESEHSLRSAQQLADEAETLRQASAVVLQALDQQEAIRRILEQLAHVLPYDSASVQLLRDGELEIVGGRGWDDPDAVIGMRFSIPGDNPNTEIVQEHTPVVLRNAPQAYSEFRKPPHDHIRSFLGVPLIVRDRLIGVLAIDSQKPDSFTDDHVRVASAFADQVAIAIENARLYSDLQELSQTDALTGLHNRRGLTELGRRELERARRFNHALSVLMFDLDRFKAVNDTHGHGVGDSVLVGIADRCRGKLRDVDILGRYGGEEFVALLPETDLGQASEVAERLRQEVGRQPFETEAGTLSVTISVGVAAWSSDIDDLDELLAHADGALYEAKASGRNRVRGAPEASPRSSPK
ncbi:MAG: diguanylate cyclase [Candidatus Bipolaricaulia bacterium]